MRDDLPTGTVTFLFTDVEGSTRLLHELGAESYAKALGEHRRVVREACTAHGGVEVDTQGDAFFFAFPTAPGALTAAKEATDALSAGPIRIRAGVNTGTPLLTAEGYVGADIHRAARIAASGHGGQILVSSSTANLIELGLRDLGEHRLKDLSAPERIYQLGDGEFPRLKSLYQTNLPIPSTPFVGRMQEMSDVVGLLSRHDVRLLTLTGPGGVGKTRLAAQAAGGLSDAYPDGVWWIPLSPLRDPDLVPLAVGQALGAEKELAAHIADRSMLLLFDNFEHVVEAAAEVAGLLTTCPRLNVLVTSREPLHVTGEQEYPVSGLRHEEGVGLFLARARAVEPEFRADEAVSEICRHLDELPLALELAAARVKALSPAQILERLDQRLSLLTGGSKDLPERQRTLRATLEWSYELLEPGEQRLFARLAVFSGGCTLEAAKRVSGADVDTLQSLIDKSLLRHTDERFWMLETTHEYAAQRLDGSGEAEEFRRRHAHHFLAFAEEAEPNLRWSGSPGEWLDRLEAEHDNLRAALDWMGAAGESQLSLQLTGALYRFWLMRSHLAEGGRRLETALAADKRPTEARARALDGSAVIVFGDDPAMAKLRAEEALVIQRALNDVWGAAFSGLIIGEILTDEGDLARAQELFDASRLQFRELGDEHYTLLATQGLAGVYEDLGDLQQARALHEDTLRLARAQSNRRLVARALGQLAPYARDEGRIDEALAMLKESLTILLDLGDRLGIAEDFGRIARTLAVAGRPGAAVQLVSAAEVLFGETGRTAPSWAATRNEETLAIIRSQLDGAAVAEAWEQGRAFTIDKAVALALDC